MISDWKHGRFSRCLIAAWLLQVVVCATSSTMVHGGTNGIEVRGNRRIATDQIKSLFTGAKRNGDPVRSALKRVQDAYFQEGFLLARLSLQQNDVDSTLILQITEGEQARYRNVDVRGAEVFGEEDIKTLLGAKAEERFRPVALSRRIEELLERYDEKGYPFAQVWMDSLQLDHQGTGVDLVVYVFEGGKKTIRTVGFDGLRKTREDLAVKLSGLQAGEPYSSETLREALLRLSSSGIFDSVDYPDIRMSPDGTGVQALIRVIEPAKRNSFSSALGYSDREGEEDRVLSGMVRIDLLNIGGSLKDLNLFWRNDGAGRSETKLAFKQRFFFGRRLNFGVLLEQIGLDTLYTWQSLGVETSAPVGRLWGGLFGVDIAAFGDRNTFSEGPVNQSWRLRLLGGYSYVLGKTRTGTFVEISNRHAYARKKIKAGEAGADETVAQYIVEFSTKAAFDISRHVHLSNEINYMGLESREAVVPLSEQFYLGGAATLRGYRENQFHGRRVAYTRSELLLGRSRRENAYMFVDVGYVFQEREAEDSSIIKDERIRAGYGFGLRTESRAGNIDISFGVGERLSLRQTKVHVILNRSF
jgi:outer membrane protein assembly factor BamA